MHLSHSQPTLDEKFNLILDLFVTDNVLVFNLNAMVVVHADVSRAQITDAVGTPLKLARNGAVRQQRIL